LRPVTLVLLALGLLVGPGYFLYARHLTGTVVGTYPLATAQGGGFQSVAISLSPDMSPVRVILRLSAEHGPSVVGTPTAAPRNRYRAVVSRGGQAVAETGVELVSSTIESSFQEFASVVATLEVGTAGEHLVQIEGVGEPQMQATAASLELRRNATDPDMRVVWTGVALIGVALMGLVIGR
jgi:hypothetical protein